MPPYRTCFSKRQFSQPQLLATLCFMRYEDWTFRETEARLSEHGELRRALALASVPDYTTLQPFLRRLLEPTWSTPSRIVVRRVPGRRRRRTTVAVDATGLAQGAVSTFLVRRTPSSAALAALVEMVGRRRRGETTHLVPIGTAGPGEFFGCPFGSFKSSRLMVASALVNTFDSPKRVSTLRMVVSERRLMMYLPETSCASLAPSTALTGAGSYGQ